MKLDYITYSRINESFKNNIFNKVIAFINNEYNHNEELMFLRNAVESYLASIGISNLKFDHVEHKSGGYVEHKSGGYKDEDMINLIYHSPNFIESNTVYIVHVVRGLYISCIDVNVNAQEESLGNSKVVCITHKTYMLNHDLDCNIANIEVEDNIEAEKE